MVRVCITGAAGGIGSILADQLKKLGHELILIDDLSGGSLLNFENQENVSQLVESDLNDLNNLELLLENCDLVFHLAALSSLAECQKFPTKAFSSNVMATINLINACLRTDTKIIFASTSAVYEGSTSNRFSEKQILGPHLVYPQTKLHSESILNSFGKTNNLDFVNLRFFNVYGPRQNILRTNPPLVNYIIKSLALNEKPKLYAPTFQSRDYVYVGDVVELLVRFVNNEVEVNRGTYNVCSGKAISIREILDAIEIGYGKGFEVEFGNPDELWDMHAELFIGKRSLRREIVEKETLKDSLGDPSAAKQYLNWSASTDVLRQIAIETPAIIDYVKRMTC